MDAALGQILLRHPVVETAPHERLALIYQLGHNLVAQPIAHGLNERRFGLLRPQHHRRTPFDSTRNRHGARNVTRHGPPASLPKETPRP